MSGCRRRTACTTLPLPTPEGPDSTVRRDATGSRNSGLSRQQPTSGAVATAELGDQRSALLGTEATDATGRADLQALHDLVGTHLADTGQGFEDGGDLHLPDDLVVVGVGQDGLEARAGVLQALLHLGALLARDGGLLECCCALLGSQ